MSLTQSDKEFIVNAANDGHAQLLKDAVRLFSEQLEPVKVKLGEHEITLNGTEKNPGGAVRDIIDTKKFIENEKAYRRIYSVLMPPVAVAIWEGIKLIFLKTK